MRLIDADALGNRLYHEVFEKDSKDQRWDSGCWIRYRLLEKVLEEQPTVAQPERKKGKWITSDDMYETGVCSVCKCDSQEPVSYAITMFKYCPNCGAEMEVKE